MFARSRLALLTLGLVSCGSDRLGGVEVGFQVDAAPVNFGKALLGTEVKRSLLLVSAARGDTTVTLVTRPPFVAPAQAEVPGGGVVVIELTYQVTSEGPVVGALAMSAKDKTITLSLFGEGVKGQICTASALCRTSTFNLELKQCLETVNPDGAPCTPTNGCLENGTCEAGECLGEPRTCEDFNACTADACSAQGGCLHAPIACPAPTRACYLAACDPVKGCVEVQAANLTACGSVDCVIANVCINGSCSQVVPPDGFQCAPATPCEDVSRCMSQVCVRPDAGTLTPVFAIPLDGGPPSTVNAEKPLIGQGGNVFFQTCGTLGCSLRSYTANGFERFTQAQEAGTRTLGFVGETVTVLAPDALEAYDRGSGLLRWRVPFSALGGLTPGPGRMAELASSDILLAGTLATDGGHAVVQLHDGGSLLRDFAAPQSVQGLAVDETGRIFVSHGTGGLTRAESLPDGGFVLASFPASFGPVLLSTATERVFAGNEMLDADAGTPVRSFGLTSNVGDPRPLSGTEFLSARGAVFGFTNGCALAADGGCVDPNPSFHLHAMNAADGGEAWEELVLPGGVPGGITEATVVPGGGLAALTSLGLSDGGTQFHLQLFGGGNRLFTCALPSPGDVVGAAFEGSSLFVLIQRSGVWKLEAYDLAGLPLEQTGWPVPGSVGNTRRAR